MLKAERHYPFRLSSMWGKAQATCLESQDSSWSRILSPEHQVKGSSVYHSCMSQAGVLNLELMYPLKSHVKCCVYSAERAQSFYQIWKKKEFLEKDNWFITLHLSFEYQWWYMSSSSFTFWRNSDHWERRILKISQSSKSQKDSQVMKEFQWKIKSLEILLDGLLVNLLIC